MLIQKEMCMNWFITTRVALSLLVYSIKEQIIELFCKKRKNSDEYAIKYKILVQDLIMKSHLMN
jgi:hypothetical protein